VRNAGRFVLWLDPQLATAGTAGNHHAAARSNKEQRVQLVSSVWRAGSGAQWVKIANSWADFKASDTTYFSQGLRLVDFEVENGAYTGVWQPGSGAQWVHAGLSWADFKTQDTTYFQQGLRIADIDVDSGAYSGVWRPGDGAQWVHPNLAWADFKSQDTTYFNEGLRLTDIEVDGGMFTGVWRPGTGTQWVHPNISPDDLLTLDATYQNAGLRISILKVKDGKLTAVWRPGSGAQRVEIGLSVERFAAEDKAHFDAGLRLKSLAVHQQPVVIYKLPFGDATGWVLSNGNWDDPTHGHNQGNPLGWQSYAYDFTHAEGGKILAARGGTVYDLDESSSANGFNANDPCHPGVGNYLVIKHIDGSFGVYWHMQHNGVLVKVGDKVSQGQEVASSGNTGNSSAPHLHFDSRIDWDVNYSCSNLHEYPGYPVFFQDKTHQFWRPKVGDTLATNNG
jgi:murein DD-endopeptidase MepM/ murein hydrolase activator NlpD